MDATLNTGSPQPLEVEVRLRPRGMVRTLLLVTLALVAYYLYVGRLTTFMWVGAAVLPVAAILALKQVLDRRPCLVIDEEGIFDRRLKLGTISWTDIRRAYMHAVGGVYFICLELHNADQYLSRQPLLLRLSGHVWKLYGVPPVNIKVAYMDADPEELFELVMSRCEIEREDNLALKR